MLGERTASKSEVIRASVSGCGRTFRQQRAAVLAERWQVRVLRRHPVGVDTRSSLMRHYLSVTRLLRSCL